MYNKKKLNIYRINSVLPKYQDNRPNYREMYADEMAQYYPYNPPNYDNVIYDPLSGQSQVGFQTTLPNSGVAVPQPNFPAPVFPSDEEILSKDTTTGGLATGTINAIQKANDNFDNVTPEVDDTTNNKKSTAIQGFYGGFGGVGNPTTGEYFYNAGALGSAARGIRRGDIDAPEGYGKLASIGSGVSTLGGIFGGVKDALAGAATQKSFYLSEQERERQNRRAEVDNATGQKGQYVNQYMRTNIMGRQFQDGGYPYMMYQEGGENPYAQGNVDPYFQAISNEITSQPTNPNNNVELEDGEFVIDTETGDVKYVRGQEHQETSEYKGIEYSGVPTQMKQSEVVISNNGKVDKKIAKSFGSPNAKTYAQIVAKHPVQKEINKINEKIAELTTKAEKYLVESKDPKVQETNKRNLDYISGEINELNEELQPYKQEILNVAKQVYMLQEQAKQTGQYEGIKPPLQQEGFQDGGIKDRLFGKDAPPDAAIEEVKNFLKTGKEVWNSSWQPYVDDVKEFLNTGKSVWMSSWIPYVEGVKNHVIEGTKDAANQFRDPQVDSAIEATKSLIRGGKKTENSYFQEGGQQDQIVQMVAQALQQGVEPQQILQGLVEQGIPQEQAMQLIQQIMQQMQGGQQQAPQQPQMQDGEVNPYLQQQPQQPQQDQMQQIVQGVAAMLQQGADPREVFQQLVEMGIPEQEAQQLIQAVMSQLQGQPQAQQPMMQEGGMQAMQAEQVPPNPYEQIAQDVAVMLQQGAEPQEVFQQLVENGVPEEEAQQLIQSVMAQLQGQAQQMMMDGGRPGLWENIRRKRERGERPSPKNSKAYKDAVKAGKKINESKSKKQDGGKVPKYQDATGTSSARNSTRNTTRNPVEILPSGTEFRKLEELERKGDYESIDKITKGLALPYVPSGQSKTIKGLYGEVTDADYAETINRNPWFDWSNFDPSKEADVLRFQQEYNEIARRTGAPLVKEDGKFGEQTSSIRVGWDLTPERERREVPRERPDRPEEEPEFEVDPYDREASRVSGTQAPFIGYRPDIRGGVRIPPQYQVEREEISPVKISPEQTLRENAKQAALYGNLISQNVGMTGSNAAAIADTSNKAIMESQRFNAQEAARVEAANAQSRMAQNQANINLMDTYNQRAILAEENTLNQINQARREQRDWDRQRQIDAQTWAAMQASYPNYNFAYNPFSRGYDVAYVDRGQLPYVPSNQVTADAEKMAQYQLYGGGKSKDLETAQEGGRKKKKITVKKKKK